MELHHFCQFVNHGKNWGHLKHHYMEQHLIRSLLLTNIEDLQTLITPLSRYLRLLKLERSETA